MNSRRLRSPVKLMANWIIQQRYNIISYNNRAKHWRTSRTFKGKWQNFSAELNLHLLRDTFVSAMRGETKPSSSIWRCWDMSDCQHPHQSMRQEPHYQACLVNHWRKTFIHFIKQEFVFNPEKCLRHKILLTPVWKSAPCASADQKRCVWI